MSTMLFGLLLMTCSAYAGGLGDEISETQLMTGLGTDSLAATYWATKCLGIPSTAAYIKVIMGTVVDYFRPVAGQTFCAMLTTYNKHQWSANAESGWVTPAYYHQHLGGSQHSWPKNNVAGDSRTYLSFWGGYTAGGCCHLSKTGGNDWLRSFTMYYGAIDVSAGTSLYNASNDGSYVVTSNLESGQCGTLELTAKSVPTPNPTSEPSATPDDTSAPQPDPSATPIASCPTHWTEVNGYCYIGNRGNSIGLNSNRRTREASETECQSVGATLATVHDADQGAQVYSNVWTGDGVGGVLWIGLSKNSNGQMEWADGSAVGTYRKWHANVDDSNVMHGKCVYYNGDKWSAGVDCVGSSWEFMYVCSKPLTPADTPPEPTATPNPTATPEPTPEPAATPDPTPTAEPTPTTEESAISYQWFRADDVSSSNSQPISGATSSTYTPVSADGGMYLFVQVTESGQSLVAAKGQLISLTSCTGTDASGSSFSGRIVPTSSLLASRSRQRMRA